ncbi:hypothetical protein M408DRAFT_193237 [Serendipita vermifera MAFF 305830]|uniref:Uncharacterized protein n=1 Tax=Serendipita vermifera MAFF 305830 TaxID=933852 RepID=A0A0C3APD2_SERVB|nr:hypothetical protein M408DRAFT_193237 [Serendipita vermifera MAFF 305830]
MKTARSFTSFVHTIRTRDYARNDDINTMFLHSISITRASWYSALRICKVCGEAGSMNGNAK